MGVIIGLVALFTGIWLLNFTPFWEAGLLTMAFGFVWIVIEAVTA